jgi:hypothetical protein
MSATAAFDEVDVQQRKIIETFRARVWRQGYLTKEGRRIKSWKRYVLESIVIF